jgi:hypothetical protein
MTTLGDQLVRIRDLLQETRPDPTVTEELMEAHREAIQELVRKGAFTNIVWVNTVAGQSQYTLPATAVHVDQVLYNDTALRFTTERALDRTKPGWESLSGEPVYWLTDNQAPNVIRLVPTPVRTGSALPHFPPVPLLFDTEDNLVIFLTEDLSGGVENEGDTLPTLLDWDDYLVWRAAGMVAARETEVQNLPVARVLGQLGGLHAPRLSL